MELNAAGWLVILVGRAGLNRARWLAVLDPEPLLDSEYTRAT
jgi:hypothetical protein